LGKLAKALGIGPGELIEKWGMKDEENSTFTAAPALLVNQVVVR
jgi:hypothetical protein